MRLLILAAAALALPATLVAAPSKPSQADCRIKPRYAKAEGKGELRKLDELPPGKLVLTVFRRDQNGCPVPLVIREGMGAQPRR